MTLNPWQRKAQERYEHGAFNLSDVGEGWRAVTDPRFIVYDDESQSLLAVSLPTLLERLAYERQECGTCEGDGGCICVLCDPDEEERYAGKSEPCGTHEFIYVDHEEYGESCNGTGLTSDYRKAQEWAVKLGVAVTNTVAQGL